MEMPRVTEHHRKLERLVGHWTGEETMHPSNWDPKGFTATGTTSSRLALSGFAIIGDYRQERDGQTTFEGHAVYTYDQTAAEVVLYWFDCLGTPPNLFRGNFEGDVLTLISDESSERGPHLSRITNEFAADGALISRMEASQNGAEWTSLMDGRYSRSE